MTVGLSKARGNMYPWVTHTWNPMAGQCPHKCAYCYVKRGSARLSGKYEGEPRLLEMGGLGKGRAVFVCSCSDLFAEGVAELGIVSVLEHCASYPHNRYLFQTKNPGRLVRLVKYDAAVFGALSALHGCGAPMFATTLETNRDTSDISDAPSPSNRAAALAAMTDSTRIVTVEPILKFDLHEFAAMIASTSPEWVNIGADSKRTPELHGMEPTGAEVAALIRELSLVYGIEVKRKSNLERLVKARAKVAGEGKGSGE